MLGKEVKATLVLALRRHEHEDHFPTRSFLGDVGRLGVVLTRHTDRLVVFVDHVAGNAQSSREWQALLQYAHEARRGENWDDPKCEDLPHVAPLSEFTKKWNPRERS